MKIQFRLIANPSGGVYEERVLKPSYSLVGLERIVDPRKGKSGYTYIRYLEEEQSPFVDEQSTPFSIDDYRNRRSKVKRITFIDEMIGVDEHNLCLLGFLRNSKKNRASDIKGQKVFFEVDENKFTADQLSRMDLIDQAQDLIKSIGRNNVSKLEVIATTCGFPTTSYDQMLRDVRRYCHTNPELVIRVANDSNMDVKSVILKAIAQGVIKENPNKMITWGDTQSTIVAMLPGDKPLEVLTAYFNSPQGRPHYEALTLKLDARKPHFNPAEIVNEEIAEVEGIDLERLAGEAETLGVITKEKLGYKYFNGINLGRDAKVLEYLNNNPKVVEDLRGAVLIAKAE